MEIKQLEAFFHVAELGSFTRAAIVLNTTQPALSRLVRQLENELRQSLLMRNGRGVVMTEVGQVMLGHAKSIVQQSERARQDIDERRGNMSGQFNIGLLPSVARLTASNLVRDFSRYFPDAKIAITEGLSTYLLEWLQSGRLDAAVLYDTNNTPFIEKRELLEQELFLVGASNAKADAEFPKSPVSFKTIDRYRLIMPSRTHGVRHVIENRAAEMGLRLNIVIEVDALPSILDLVADGFGYAVQTTNAISSDPYRRKFNKQRFSKPVPTLSLALATGTRHPLSKLAEKALDLVEKNVNELYAEPGKARISAAGAKKSDSKK